MTKRDFIELTGEDPEDMFGPDWKQILEDFNEHIDEDNVKAKHETP